MSTVDLTVIAESSQGRRNSPLGSATPDITVILGRTNTTPTVRPPTPGPAPRAGSARSAADAPCSVVSNGRPPAGSDRRYM
ncbi:hypothetical protein ACFYZE_21000 [Streptomyces sp. NPDC001796]|uniref:hypothetical protein n=1 Tax=Streptomyces sp. NPDC001796 TaxID=3364609 RepID=UPI0036AC1405